MKEQPKSMAIEGFFLEFTAEELEDVRHELDVRGYEQNGAGIKDFLLDELFNDEPVEKKDTDFIQKAQDYLKEHPEAIQMGMNLASSLLKGIKKK